MTFRPRLFLTLVLALAGAAFVPAALRAQNAPVILSLSYDSTFSTQYIGTTLTVEMTAIQPNVSAPFAVSVTAFTAGAGGSVTLGGLFSGSVTPGATIYVSDGTRTWGLVYSSGNSITINETELIGGAYVPPSWVVGDYSLLSNDTFSVYTGTLVTNATTDAQMSVDIGAFTQFLVYDNATNGDVAADDGIWTAKYTTPNLGKMVTDAFFYGQCLVNGVPAVNESFQSALNVSFDMELPGIVTISSSTTNDNYNGDLYLSSQCEGLSVTYTAAVNALANASCAQAQFNFAVNKADTTVLVTISGMAAQSSNVTSYSYPAYPMVPVTLPPYVFPSGTTSLSGWSVWNGADGNNNFVPDGIYTVSYFISDNDGLSGVTITSKIKVVSMQMGISNITLSPSNIGTEPAITDGVITTINYTVSLYNDSANSNDMNSSLGVLGWGDAGKTSSTFPFINGLGLTTTAINGVDSSGDAESTIWTMQTQGYLSPNGTFTAFLPSVDSQDGDIFVAEDLYPFFGVYGNVLDENPQNLGTEDCSNPVGGYPANTYVVTGDNDPTNDWYPKGFTYFGLGNGTLNPTTISQQNSVSWVGSTPPAGGYRISLQSQLTGLAFVGGPPNPPVADVGNPCSGTASASPVYVGDEYHFWPQTQIDTLDQNHTWSGPIQGDEISCSNATAIFNVNATANPTGDGTPPQFLVSSPAANSLLQPGVYSNSTPLSVEFQDTIANFNTGPSFSYITLSGPQGTISGQSSTNLGGADHTLTIYFQPDSSLIVGGTYTMTAYTCNVDGLCVQQTIPFTVLDTTAPSIVSNGVVLSSQIGSSTIPISLCQSTPAGPYQFINQVAVTIAIPGTSKNTINLPGCSVSLYQISGTAQLVVPITQLTSQNVTTTQATLVYSINSVLDTSALYEVVTQTQSLDASGVQHTGPPAQPSGSDCTNAPEFSTEVCTTCLDLLYGNNPNNNCPAVTSALPSITVASQGSAVTVGSITANKPAIAGLPMATGYEFLQTAAANPSSSDPELEFYVGGVLEPNALVWTYATGADLQFSLWYNQSDLATAAGGQPVSASNLQILGYNGSWHVVNDAVVPVSPTETTVQCTIPVPNGSAAYVYYALAFPSSLTSTAGSGTPIAAATPVTFPDTRAFNPGSSDARFYYSTVQPRTLQVDIYDTAGRRVRSLSLGNQISAMTFTTDPTYANSMYYFEWDGTNDAGHVLRNGIYLVRWNETGIDGSNHTQVKPVALIK